MNFDTDPWVQKIPRPARISWKKKTKKRGK